MALSKKAKKIIIISAAIVVGLPILVLLIVIIKLNSIVRWGVETGGSRALGVPVQLQKVDISLLREDVTLAGLNVGNPQGFTSPSLVKVGGMHLAANVRALMRHEAHIRDITVTGPEFTIEVVGTKTNIGTLAGQLDKGETSAPAEEKQPQAQQAKGPELKVKIDHLRLSDVKLHVVKDGKTETKSLPSIELSDIADANGNAVPVTKVVQAVLKRVAAEAAAAGIEKALDKELKRLGPEGSGAADKVKGGAGKIIGNILK